MGKLFKPKFKRYYNRETGRVVTKDHANAELREYQTEKWYGRYRDYLGIVRRKPLHKNKDIAREELVQLERDADDRRRGRVDRFEKHRKVALSEHRDRYEKSLKAKGRSADYVTDTIRYVRLVSERCGFAFLQDINADAVEQFANDLRETPFGAGTDDSEGQLGRSARTVKRLRNRDKEFLPLVRRLGSNT